MAAELTIGAVGLIGLAGLYSTCLQTLEQIDTGRNIETSANSLYARLTATIHLYQKWGEVNGIRDGIINETSHHWAFEHGQTRTILIQVLANIEHMMADQKRVSERYGLSMPLQSTSLSTRVQDARDQMSNTDFKAPRKGLIRRAKWAISDKSKFAAFVEELEVIVDRLYMLASPDELLSSRQLAADLTNLKSHISGKSQSFINMERTIPTGDRCFSRSRQEHGGAVFSAEEPTLLFQWYGSPAETGINCSHVD